MLNSQVLYIIYCKWQECGLLKKGEFYIFKYYINPQYSHNNLQKAQWLILGGGNETVQDSARDIFKGQASWFKNT